MFSRVFLQIFFVVLFACYSCGNKEKSNEFVDEDIKNPLQESKTGSETSDNKKTEPGGDTIGTTGNKKNPTGNKYSNSFQNEKPVAVISPVEAGEYNGKTVTVKGFVADIYKSEKVAYLNFVEKYPNNPFTAVIFASKFSDFPDIAKYKNRDVEVTGRVSIFRDKPQIILNSPSQIKLN